MNPMGFPIVTVIAFFPLAGAILLLFVPRAKEEFLKRMALVISLVEFIISLPLFIWFDEGAAGMQFVERIPWIPEWGVHYFVGIDGISLLLVLLTTFLTVLCILSSWRSVERMVKEYMIVFLILEPFKKWSASSSRISCVELAISLMVLRTRLIEYISNSSSFKQACEATARHTVILYTYRDSLSNTAIGFSQEELLPFPTVLIDAMDHYAWRLNF